MKYLLMLLLSFCFVIIAKGQDQLEKLQGTWQIKSFQHNSDPGIQQTRGNKYKSYTPSHFIVIEIDTATGVTTTSIMGTYKIADSTYSETILHINRESGGMIGRTFSFKLSFENANKIRTVGSFNGIKSNEIWERVVPGQQGMTVQTFTTRLASIPLFLLQNGKETIRLNKQVGKAKSPLSMMPQESIAAIEVLKDNTALSLYGEEGRYGVVIITIKESEQANIVKLMKEAGYID